MELNNLITTVTVLALPLYILLSCLVLVRLSRLRQLITIEKAKNETQIAGLSQSIYQNLQLLGESQRVSLDGFRSTLESLRVENANSFVEVNKSLHTNITQLNRDNSEKLEKIRQTVDEQLQSTLEKRLGQSFRIVSDRLEQVHKGIGEMQAIATGVGDLKKVLTNIKTRGIWGEVQVENILEQVLTPNQYCKNVQVNPRATGRVEFAIKIPSKDELEPAVYIPIDAKFPLEDYQLLIAAQDEGDSARVQSALEVLVRVIKQQAKMISEKYIVPPHTTDFAIMFLPIEGLYAEVLKHAGLVEHLQHKYRIIITSPTTFSAILNSLQMGFKTLAIEKRTSEVWNLLNTVRHEFTRFAGILSKTKTKLDQASKIIGEAESKSRNIERKLSRVELLGVANNGLLDADEIAANDTIGVDELVESAEDEEILLAN